MRTLKFSSTVGYLFFILLFLTVSVACDLFTGGKNSEVAADEGVPTAEFIAGVGKQETTPFQQPSTEEERELNQMPGIPDRPLSSVGPWLVFSTEGGIWAVNPDGSGLTRLTGTPNMKLRLLAEGAAPTGGKLAYITSQDVYFQLTLNMITLPEGKVEVITPLVSNQWEPPKDLFSDHDLAQMARAIAEQPSLAWSNDGERLAFMGAIEGRTSDLYVYDHRDKSITQLTDGPSQGFHPVWSPDDEYIFHFGASTFGVGAGYMMDGVWAAKADKTNVLTLYDPGNSGAEEFRGWVDDSTFVVSSWNLSCGSNMLRTYDIFTHVEKVLWEHCFTNAAFWPEIGSIAITIDEYAARDNPEGLQGVLLFKPGSATPEQVLDGNIYNVVFSPEAYAFMTYVSPDVYLITSIGTVLQIDAITGNLPKTGYSNMEFAWYGSEGLWVNVPTDPSIPIRRIFNGKVIYVTWDLHSEYLLFFTDSAFYVAKAPEFIPVMVSDQLSTKDVTWVMP
jgi:hypothetical protein